MNKSSEIPAPPDTNLQIYNTRKFKTITLCALLRQPLKRETATHMAMLPGVLERGSATYDTAARITSHMEQMYGGVMNVQIIKKGEYQLLQFYLEVLDRNRLFEEGLDFLREIIQNPLVEDGGFKAEYVEREKEALRNVIRGRVNNKAEYAKLRCLEEMCRNEPFGIYGDGYEEDLAEITPRSLYKFYRKIVDSPMQCIVIGNVSEPALGKLSGLLDRQGGCRSNASGIPDPAESVRPKHDSIRVTERMDTVQGKICIGLRPCSDVSLPPKVPAPPDYYKLLLMNEVLGGGGNSKLYLNAREKKSLCYYINSFVYRQKSIVMIQSGVDKENFEKIEGAVARALEELQSGQISHNELELAKAGLLKTFMAMRDYPASLINFIAMQSLAGSHDSLESAEAKIEALSARDVREAAESLYIDTIFILANRS
ncbi:MAG: insulinase family protein [Clostridiales bacterium]|nr:insulinase family protein [Clostridiales bacterium]